MKTKLSAGAFALAFSHLACSTDNILLNDIVITASRVPQTQEALIADVTVIQAEEIQRNGQGTLVELLQRQAGIEITNNGGPGKVSGIFMRGTNTNHVVLLIDGVRVQSATTGAASFENLPTEIIDRVEILRGPASSLYGPDAIGGVIQVFTKKGQSAIKPFANVGYGGYDTAVTSGGVRGKVNQTSFALSLSASEIGGFSSLDANNSPLNDRDGYRNLASSINLNHQIANGHEVGLQFFNSRGSTRFDNRFNSNPRFSSKAEIEQQSFALLSNNQITSNWLSKVRIAEGRDNSTTLDQTSRVGGAIFNTRQFQVNWQNDLTLPIGTLTLMYDRLEDRVDSTTNFVKNKRNNEGFVASYLATIGAHSLHSSLREDHNSQFGNYTTGGLGYGYRINDQWRLSASYGNAFKAPTFNDLYFPGFSNPNLRPEKSDNVEASVKYQDQHFFFSATAFENRIRDLIAFTSTVENINKSKIQGLSLVSQLQWEQFDVAASVDIQSPRNLSNGNQLIRRANRNGKLNIGYTWQDWRWGAEVISASQRYNDNANQISMGGYTVFNLTTQYKVNPDWSIQARANNIFDKNYRVALDGNPATTGFAYNMPGANLFVNVRYEPQ